MIHENSGCLADTSVKKDNELKLIRVVWCNNYIHSKYHDIRMVCLSSHHISRLSTEFLDEQLQ